MWAELLSMIFGYIVSAVLSCDDKINSILRLEV